MGAGASKKKQYLKIGSSKYKIVSVESADDVVTQLIVSETKTKEKCLLKKMLINSGSNTIDYLSGADILSRLPSHPNIVRYIGSSHFVHQDGSIEFALLTENCASWLTLSDLIQQKLLTEFKLKLKAFEDICHSIQHCHKHKIAHLSIHPRNILQDGFGIFKLSNFDAAIIMNSGMATSGNNNFINHAIPYTRNSIFSNIANYPSSTLDSHHHKHKHAHPHHQHHSANAIVGGNDYDEEQKTIATDESIFIAPELLDPKQYTAVLDNKLFEKADIWSLGCLLLYLLYDGMTPQWYTNKLGVREADCSMFLGSYASKYVKTNMIHSNPHKRISISEVLKFVSKSTEYNDPIKFLSTLSPKSPSSSSPSPRPKPKAFEHQNGFNPASKHEPKLQMQGTVSFEDVFLMNSSNHHNNKKETPSDKKKRKKSHKHSSMYNNPIDSMINKILKTNSHIFYNRLMVSFWDNSNDKETLRSMVERVYMSSSIICNRSSLTAIKLLTLLHRLFLQTPQEFMKASIVELKFYNQLIEFWKIDSSQDFMKDLVISYAKFMIARLKFHSKNPIFESNFSVSLYMYNHHKRDYASFECHKWFDDISQSFIDLIDFGRNHCSLINAILSHKGFNTSIAAQYANAMDVGNILNSCLIPLFEDLHSLYLITTWIIGLLRVTFGKKKSTIYSDKYKDFMISLIAVVSRMQNTASVVWNCIDIDTNLFPKQVPKISSIVLLDMYPPSSFAPNLSAFNRELVNHFVNVVNQQLDGSKTANAKHRARVTPQSNIKSDDDESDEMDLDVELHGARADGERTNHLQLLRAKTDVGVKRKESAHKRSRSSNVDTPKQATSINNVRTPPPRPTSTKNAMAHSAMSSPNLSPFPDIGDVTTTPSHNHKLNEKEKEQKEKKIEEEEEVKEELSFRALSRSLSSDTNHNKDGFAAHSPINPFSVMPSTKSDTINMFSADNDAFVFSDHETDNILLDNEDMEQASDTSSAVSASSLSSHSSVIERNETELVEQYHRNVIIEEEEEKHEPKQAEPEEKKTQKDTEQKPHAHTHSHRQSRHKKHGNGKRLVVGEDELKWEDLVIIERIGIGGFAEVFSGRLVDKKDHDEFDEEVEEEKVAIKKLINQNLTASNLHEFASEIEIMRKIKHPNITKFIGACTKSPNMCIVTELLEMSLFDLLHNTRLKLSVDIELKVALGASKGVAHLHEHDIIHRDLKSANILLDKHFEPRLTDFGLSRMKDQSTLTAGTGTFQWMAPEVIQGKKYNEKSDIYSLAMIFWEIKTSLIPFVSYGLNGIQASVAVVTQRKRPKIDVSVFKNKHKYDQWKMLIIKMWNQTASKRPNAAQVIQMLHAI